MRAVLGGPFEKVGDHPQAGALTFFGMELHAHHGVAPDHGGDVRAVIHMREAVRGVGDFEVVGVHKIGVIPGGDPVQNRVRVRDDQVVPAHVGHFECLVFGFDFNDFAADPVQPFGVLVLAPPAGHQLHSDANPQERAPFDLDRFYHGLVKPACAGQRRVASRKRPVAGQHDAVGPRHDVRVRGDHNFAGVDLAGHPLERFVGRVQVAALVVDDRCEHGATTPLWSRGCRRICGDRPPPLRAGRVRRT